MKVMNRKYRREYQEIERFEAGVVLMGGEVKSVKEGRIVLDDAFVKILGNEAFLINADIPLYQFARMQGYDSKRTRKLLLHKKELLRIKIKMQSGGALTVVPVSCYNKGPLFKIEVALVRGRKDIEKRKLEKRRDIEREQQREVKEYIKE